MGCSLSAIADDEDHYYYLCEKYKQEPERDKLGRVEIYGLHARMMKEFDRDCYKNVVPAKLPEKLKEFNEAYKKAINDREEAEKNRRIRFAEIKLQYSKKDWEAIERGIKENW